MYEGQTSNHLYSYCNLRYVIADVLFTRALERDFGAHDAHKHTNLILLLVNFIRVPAARKQVQFQFTTVIKNWTLWLSAIKVQEALLDAFHGGTCDNVSPLLK